MFTALYTAPQAMSDCCPPDLLQSHLQKPWAPLYNAELTPGSLHSVIGSKQMRLLLKQFIGRANDPSAGLSPHEHANMLSELDSTDRSPLIKYLVRPCWCWADCNC